MPGRCGPLDMALRMMADHASVRSLLDSMLSAVLPIQRGEEALALAATKGTLKVQLSFE